MVTADEYTDQRSKSQGTTYGAVRGVEGLPMFPSGPPRQSFAYTQAFGFGSRDNGNLLPERAESQLERSVSRDFESFHGSFAKHYSVFLQDARVDRMDRDLELGHRGSPSGRQHDAGNLVAKGYISFIIWRHMTLGD
ncbi:hypothetical protein D3C71_1448800 [compost metagenome]